MSCPVCGAASSLNFGSGPQRIWRSCSECDWEETDELLTAMERITMIELGQDPDG